MQDMKASIKNPDGNTLVNNAMNNGQVGLNSNLSQIQAAKMDFINNNETIQQTVNDARAKAQEAARQAGASAEEIAKAGDTAAQDAINQAKNTLGTKAGKQLYGKSVNNAAKTAYNGATKSIVGKSSQSVAAQVGTDTAKAAGNKTIKNSKTAETLQKTGQSLQSLASAFPDGQNVSTFGKTSNGRVGQATQNWDTLRYIQASMRRRIA